MYRNTQSSTGELLKEREANSFAAALLMPRNLILMAIDNLTDDEQDDFVQSLARKFKVSESAMGVRLSNMGLLEFGLF